MPKINKNHPIIECVLNISEGRNKPLLEEIRVLLHRPEHTYVIDMDRGESANRTVYTLVGILNDVFSAINDLIYLVSKKMNIHTHEGVHPKIGIVDVIPFVAIENITKSELEIEAKKFAATFAKDHKLPIFYYGALSHRSSQSSLAQIRKGGISLLQKNIGSSLFADQGPQSCHPTLGASCMTVRDFMSAYNINLKTKDILLAQKLSNKLLTLRSDYTHDLLLGKKPNQKIDIREVKYLAWYASEYDCCQISTNIYDINKVSLLELYNYITSIAQELSIEVDGSELIGVVPRRAFGPLYVTLDETLSVIRLDSVRPFNQGQKNFDNLLSSLTWVQ